MTATPKPRLLSIFNLFPQDVAELEKHFEVLLYPNADAETIRSIGKDVGAVLTIGSIPLPRASIEALPDLKIILNLGAGYEGVEVQAARDHNIPIVTGKGLNRDTVADHALGMLLAVIRNIPRADRMMRDGEWMKARQRMTTLTGMTIGILGLGDIGLAIARRLAGFETTILYHNRNPRSDVPYEYVASLTEMAKRCDALVIASPGGPSTHHIVNADVLEALGPEGYLVNVSRGSVVDTAALIPALENGTIKAAGLDVFEDEPKVPDELKTMDHVVLTPHVAGTSVPAVSATIERAIANYLAVLEGRDLISQV
jgi:lactate dehydrogenase-like 2-hydroxyacid dehydrogenase